MSARSLRQDSGCYIGKYSSVTEAKESVITRGSLDYTLASEPNGIICIPNVPEENAPTIHNR
jgi:hypothetical protein